MRSIYTRNINLCRVGADSTETGEEASVSSGDECWNEWGAA